ncbi:protein phosphatase [Deinococcus cavernae]|uniref:Protein phosphatase n=1 Tax=Deinococcus cavernae TaxID=2320857 RepID=A0A418V9C3_9DEIO|nr:metallophosphoesterase [Deinococcus cavernae]RJF72680.1 protein phosphatase [Deinococcus cavernae]
MRYDIIGDVHGCFDELAELLRRLGHRVDGKRLDTLPGRQVVFVGDLVDRGPKTPEVLELIMDAAARGAAQVVRGNHDDRLALYLRGWPIRSAGSIDSSLRQLAHRSVEFQQQVMDFLGSLPPRLLLADGELLVTHAGDILTDDEAARAEFNVNSARTGVVDEFGVKELVDWVSEYAGEHFVVYGHETVLEPLHRARTLNLDTGCVYGGRLTALRFPEMQVVSVAAHAPYATAKRWVALQAVRS